MREGHLVRRLLNLVTTRSLANEHGERLVERSTRVTHDGTLQHAHYEPFYTTLFGLTRSDFADKRVVDIYCGPRGRLEWATGAAVRVGLDPLAVQYRLVATRQHQTAYVAAAAEAIPLLTATVDIVTAFNALNRVPNVNDVILEMTRITKRGGVALVILEISHRTTRTEPHRLRPELIAAIRGWTLEYEDRRVLPKGAGLYDGWDRGTPWRSGHGWLAARLTRDR